MCLQIKMDLVGLCLHFIPAAVDLKIYERVYPDKTTYWLLSQRMCNVCRYHELLSITENQSTENDVLCVGGWCNVRGIEEQ